MRTVDILLAEDDQLDVMDIRRSLDKLEILYHIDHAKNGEEALDILQRREHAAMEMPDIVLLDINMPKMTGLEVLEAIRKHPKWKNLKCFVITTSSENTDKKAAASLGVSGYIVKPIKMNSASNMDIFNLMIDLMNFKKQE